MPRPSRLDVSTGTARACCVAHEASSPGGGNTQKPAVSSKVATFELLLSSKTTVFELPSSGANGFLTAPGQCSAVGGNRGGSPEPGNRGKLAGSSGATELRSSKVATFQLASSGATFELPVASPVTASLPARARTRTRTRTRTQPRLVIVLALALALALVACVHQGTAFRAGTGCFDADGNLLVDALYRLMIVDPAQDNVPAPVIISPLAPAGTLSAYDYYWAPNATAPVSMQIMAQYSADTAPTATGFPADTAAVFHVLLTMPIECYMAVGTAPTYNASFQLDGGVYCARSTGTWQTSWPWTDGSRRFEYSEAYTCNNGTSTYPNGNAVSASVYHDTEVGWNTPGFPLLNIKTARTASSTRIPSATSSATTTKTLTPTVTRSVSYTATATTTQSRSTSVSRTASVTRTTSRTTSVTATQTRFPSVTGSKLPMASATPYPAYLDVETIFAAVEDTTTGQQIVLSPGDAVPNPYAPLRLYAVLSPETLSFYNAYALSDPLQRVNQAPRTEIDALMNSNTVNCYATVASQWRFVDTCAVLSDGGPCLTATCIVADGSRPVLARIPEAILPRSGLTQTAAVVANPLLAYAEAANTIRGENPPSRFVVVVVPPPSTTPTISATPTPSTTSTLTPSTSTTPSVSTSPSADTPSVSPTISVTSSSSTSATWTTSGTRSASVSPTAPTTPSLTPTRSGTATITASHSSPGSPSRTITKTRSVTRTVTTTTSRTPTRTTTTTMTTTTSKTPTFTITPSGIGTTSPSRTTSITVSTSPGFAYDWPTAAAYGLVMETYIVPPSTTAYRVASMTLLGTHDYQYETWELAVPAAMYTFALLCIDAGPAYMGIDTTNVVAINTTGNIAVTERPIISGATVRVDVVANAYAAPCPNAGNVVVLGDPAAYTGGYTSKVTGGVYLTVTPTNAVPFGLRTLTISVNGAIVTTAVPVSVGMNTRSGAMPYYPIFRNGTAADGTARYTGPLSDSTYSFDTLGTDNPADIGSRWFAVCFDRVINWAVIYNAGAIRAPMCRTSAGVALDGVNPDFNVNGVSGCGTSNSVAFYCEAFTSTTVFEMTIAAGPTWLGVTLRLGATEYAKPVKLFTELPDASWRENGNLIENGQWFTSSNTPTLTSQRYLVLCMDRLFDFTTCRENRCFEVPNCLNSAGAPFTRALTDTPYASSFSFGYSKGSGLGCPGQVDATAFKCASFLDSSRITINITGGPTLQSAVVQQGAFTTTATASVAPSISTSATRSRTLSPTKSLTRSPSGAPPTPSPSTSPLVRGWPLAMRIARPFLDVAMPGTINTLTSSDRYWYTNNAPSPVMSTANLAYTFSVCLSTAVNLAEIALAGAIQVAECRDVSNTPFTGNGSETYGATFGLMEASSAACTLSQYGFQFTCSKLGATTMNIVILDTPTMRAATIVLGAATPSTTASITVSRSLSSSTAPSPSQSLSPSQSSSTSSSGSRSPTVSSSPARYVFERAGYHTGVWTQYTMEMCSDVDGTYPCSTQVPTTWTYICTSPRLNPDTVQLQGLITSTQCLSSQSQPTISTPTGTPGYYNYAEGMQIEYVPSDEPAAPGCLQILCPSYSTGPVTFTIAGDVRQRFALRRNASMLAAVSQSITRSFSPSPSPTPTVTASLLDPYIFQSAGYHNGAWNTYTFETCSDANGEYSCTAQEPTQWTYICTSPRLVVATVMSQGLITSTQCLGSLSRPVIQTSTGGGGSTYGAGLEFGLVSTNEALSQGCLQIKCQSYATGPVTFTIANRIRQRFTFRTSSATSQSRSVSPSWSSTYSASVSVSVSASTVGLPVAGQVFIAQTGTALPGTANTVVAVSGTYMAITPTNPVLVPWTPTAHTLTVCFNDAIDANALISATTLSAPACLDMHGAAFVPSSNTEYDASFGVTAVGTGTCAPGTGISFTCAVLSSSTVVVSIAENALVATRTIQLGGTFPSFSGSQTRSASLSFSSSTSWSLSSSWTMTTTTTMSPSRSPSWVPYRFERAGYNTGVWTQYTMGTCSDANGAYPCSTQGPTQWTYICTSPRLNPTTVLSQGLLISAQCRNNYGDATISTPNGLPGFGYASDGIQIEYVPSTEPAAPGCLQVLCQSYAAGPVTFTIAGTQRFTVRSGG